MSARTGRPPRVGGPGARARTRVRGVRWRAVAVGTLLVAALVAGVVLLAEGLRHPLPDSPTRPADAARALAGADADDDPRVEVECPEPVPADPVPREAPVLGERTPLRVSSSDLHACPETYDRALVTYEGEAVGAVMRRRGGAWVQLNDDVYAGAQGPLPAHRDYRGGNDGVGVFMPHGLADEIVTVGRPGFQGDVVAITGTFHRVHPVHGDVVVIEAHAGDVVRAGAPFEDVRLPDREIAAALLAVVAAGLIAAERVGAVRWRRG